MTVRTLNTAQLAHYDGSNEEFLITAVGIRLEFLRKRVEELPKEIEEKKLELTGRREEIERLGHSFPRLRPER